MLGIFNRLYTWHLVWFRPVPFWLMGLMCFQCPGGNQRWDRRLLHALSWHSGQFPFHAAGWCGKMDRWEAQQGSAQAAGEIATDFLETTFVPTWAAVNCQVISPKSLLYMFSYTRRSPGYHTQSQITTWNNISDLKKLESERFYQHDILLKIKDAARHSPCFSSRQTDTNSPWIIFTVRVYSSVETVGKQVRLHEVWRGTQNMAI